MATVRFDFTIAADPARVWDAVRDFGAVHTRLAVGFVTDAKLEDDVRTVTFFNGLAARETLVTRDDAARRMVYAIIGGERVSHYNAVVEVTAQGSGSRFVWTLDFLPAAMEEPIRAMAAKSVEAMKRTLETNTG